ncbi:claudin-8-like [Coregonus clupeaformis]|uniref:claudin-8-like n=1 Tax=Coregonus clupeaformis TaxID=59861 RepID=UPI001E1C557F|nr:claudin-8-like [Coregonus clupeaformis]
MVQGVSEMAALCVGLVGLMGAAAVTGMPMWKVTAFIGENIIVMETRWEGLWMNCYRQANIRMQCKVYDSLLFLPPDLQAARGLMCCSLALSGLGLLGALAGMRCTSCIQDNDRAKTLILRVAGGMQLLASICVFTPVSWMAHTIIRDFYNPLLIDAQRRELGEALYIGWVTGAVLFTSGLLFLCRRVPSASFDIYHPANRINKPTLTRYHPISSVPSMRANHQPGLNHQQSHGFDAYQHHQAPILHNSPYGQHVMNPSAAVDDTSLVENVGPLVYHHGSADGHHPSTSNSSNYVSSLSTPGNSLYISQQTNPYSTVNRPIHTPTVNRPIHTPTVNRPIHTPTVIREACLLHTTPVSKPYLRILFSSGIRAPEFNHCSLTTVEAVLVCTSE